jgi:hypothetical protein
MHRYSFWLVPYGLANAKKAKRGTRLTRRAGNMLFVASTGSERAQGGDYNGGN